MAQTIAQALREIADGLAGSYTRAERLYAIVARLEAGACGNDPMPPEATADEPGGPLLPPDEHGPGIGGGGGK